MQTSSEPVAISTPLPATTTPALSGPADQTSHPTQSPKPESHLTSLASAGLRTSPSPGFEAPGNTDMASFGATNPADPQTTAGKEQDEQHQNNPFVAREALTTTAESRMTDKTSSPDVVAAAVVDASASANEPAVASGKAPLGSTDDMQVDTYTHSASLAEPAAGADEQETSHASLMNTSTVASPGPIDDVTSQDNSRLHQQTDLPDDGSKSYSYPAPSAAALDARRGFSLPHSGFHKGSPRSPSQKKHRCPYCATEFTRHHNLKSHLLTHSQEKPYVCQTCQSRFRRLHDLKRHTKLHTGERPHICDKCGRRFARGDALARHNKGQGGCAGRRSSMGSYAGEEEFGEGAVGPDDTMDGLMYTEPERMDEEEERRLGIPAIRKHNNVSSEPMPRVSAPYQNRAPSTYPPVASAQASQPTRGLFPPPVNHGGGSSSSTSPISTTGTMNFPATTHSSSSTSFPAPNITESPRPLSPNLPASQVGHGSDASGILSHQQHRSHSPSQDYQSSQFRPGQRPPRFPVPQLPPPPGLGVSDSRFLHGQGSAQNGPPASALTGKLGSSHSHSSSLGAPPPPQANPDPTASGVSEGNVQGESREDKLWAYIRSVHEEVSALRAEVASLRSQLASQNQGASSGPSSSVSTSARRDLAN